ncbi:mobilome CxxCx(11)CxxC protein [Pseudomonas sp. S3E17]|uniref:mobilome CxxCx(11)CxxC protein n=1 Tax=Pseudomonas sp. S3E17 TaxID=2817893 RepID=UPI00209EA7B3|nr:mobilome CxxCx(11)CxxC protein [Pseudomonas sp. S3E17]MCP1466577.1 mobilome CxxCx(11)CxxC protein [Pseudomonas sp. S3E17]
MNNGVLQGRTNALVAEYIYTSKLKLLETLSLTISCLTILVPILFSAAILIAKGTPYESALNVVSIMLSVLLLTLSVFSLILKIDQRRENYLIARRSNIYVGSEALKLLHKDDSELSWFYNYLVEMDSRDQENLGSVSGVLKKEAYRYSLSKLVPGDANVVCSFCESSPFNFIPGECQVCGNTPVRRQHVSN